MPTFRTAHLRHPGDLTEAGNRHDARQYGNITAMEPGTLDQREVVLHAEKQLSDSELGSGFGLRCQHPGISVEVLGFGMPFGESGNAHAESARVPRHFDEFHGMIKALRVRPPWLTEAALWVTPQREHVSDARRFVLLQHMLQIGAALL